MCDTFSRLIDLFKHLTSPTYVLLLGYCEPLADVCFWGGSGGSVVYHARWGDRVAEADACHYAAALPVRGRPSGKMPEELALWRPLSLFVCEISGYCALQTHATCSPLSWLKKHCAPFKLSRSFYWDRVRPPPGLELFAKYCLPSRRLISANLFSKMSLKTVNITQLQLLECQQWKIPTENLSCSAENYGYISIFFFKRWLPLNLVPGVRPPYCGSLL